MLYNARLKFQRDEEARLQKAREDGIREGEARGRQEGFLAGRIVLLQELLGIRPSTGEELVGYNDAQLHDMAEQLQRQLRSRGE
jgi:flagellar biosynthesis/type III secretory pathway protein FliH